MSKTIIKIRTWRCSCGYAQDFEPTKRNHEIHFGFDIGFRDRVLRLNHERRHQALINEKSYVDISLIPEEGNCASCHLKGVVEPLHIETNLDKMTVVTVAGDEDIDADDNLSLEEKKERKKKIKDDIAKFNKFAHE